MTGLGVAFAGLGSVLGAMTLLWLVSLRLRDASIVDPFWPAGFLLVGVTYAAARGAVDPRTALVLGVLALWTLRLGGHLLRRNRAEGEDPRYRAMRERHGTAFGRVSLFTVFWLQAGLLWIVSAPVLGIVLADQPLGWWDGAGAVLALAGLTVEGVSDRQLRRFRADPRSRGSVLDSGLWRYSRHPNYFGNALMWWGIYLLAVGAGAAWTVVGPVLMNALLLWVSGVSLLERGLRRTRPEYQAYVRRTSAFIPWFPKDDDPSPS